MQDGDGARWAKAYRHRRRIGARESDEVHFAERC